MDPSLERLLDRARQAASHAYAPYSGFRVGAAIRVASGDVFTGSNVENASYGLSLCAERVAASCAASHGVRDFEALAVAASSETAPVPCGACLQFLAEFGSVLTIVTVGLSGEPVVTSLADLLPRPFKLQ